MATIENIEPVVRICAVISRHAEARAWATKQLSDSWGQIQHRTDPLPFEANGYYESQMGTDLQKELLAFAELCEPGGLADWKQETIRIENEYAGLRNHPEQRPINLDCGYVTQAKLVLATTKDRDHRIYLRDGMFAEVTLNYVAKAWVHHRWTYPDYRTEQVADFAQRCRDLVREHVQDNGKLRNRRHRNSGID